MLASDVKALKDKARTGPGLMAHDGQLFARLGFLRLRAWGLGFRI